MSMTTIYLVTADQLLQIGEKPKLASGDQNSVLLNVEFDAEWDGYGKRAVFFTEEDKTVYEIALTDNECIIPHEVLDEAGTLYIGVRGVSSANAAVKTSTLVKYRIEKGAPCLKGR